MAARPRLICLKRNARLLRHKFHCETNLWSRVTSFSNVMVYVDPQQQGQIRVAEDIAKRFGGSVIGVSAFAVIEADESGFGGQGGLVQKDRQPARREVEWRWGVEYPTNFLVNQARAADLVVVKRKQLKHDQYHYIDSAAAMLRLGRPMLSVPERVTEISADRIVVGWKETREARLAVQHALPLLTRASRVTVVELCASDQQDAARSHVRDISRYLESHGASCQYDVRVHSAESDARCLIRLAQRRTLT